MPIFEYICPKCGHRFEELIIRRSEEDQVECPQCGHKKAEKTMSTFSGGAKGESGALSGCNSSSGFS
jgi:putative FmdB family regulatory protein